MHMSRTPAVRGSAGYGRAVKTCVGRIRGVSHQCFAVNVSNKPTKTGHGRRVKEGN
ncbi:Hypothetical predicted protein, partial [Octopus vulgaris]